MRGRIALVVFACGALMAQSGNQRAPVLVELFTSEGCSSCPPADRLLAQLDARAIVLGEHVDYWDHQGWKDRFSSPAFTARQQAYGRQFNLESVYTPEMVIDGAAEFVGNDGSRAAEEIGRAARRKKAGVRLARTAVGLRIEVDAVPASAGVFLALAEDSADSQVSAGENQGRHLRHVAVVRRIQKLGWVKRGESFSREIELPRTAGAQRVVVFVQESDQGRVSGAAMLEPARG